jgi:hypothetical protein
MSVTVDPGPTTPFVHVTPCCYFRDDGVLLLL